MALTRNFPYKKSYTSKEDVYDRFEGIQEYKPVFSEEPYTIRNLPDIRDLTYLKKPKLLILPNTFDEDDISDFFFEDVRIDAKRFDESQTLREWWQQQGWKYSPSQARKSRERIYTKYHEVTTFRPTVMAGIIEFFKARSVLDFSAGWGDRLIGCLAKNIDRYTGIDPNPRIKYEQIKAFFEQEFEIRTKVNIIRKPAESPEVPKLVKYKHDLIFTSPPYFDLEVYSDDQTQSIYDKSGQKKSLDNWLEDFLFDAVWNLLPYVRYYVILVINDPPTGEKYVQRILNELSSWEELTYQGVISYGRAGQHELTGRAGRSPQPMWVWRKN